MYEIIFLNEKAEKEYLALPTGIRARTASLLGRMKQYGPHLGMPHTRRVTPNIFEVRAKAVEGIGRTLYCTQVKEKIYILHAFVKKSQKTPRNELFIARERMKEVPE